MECHFLQSPVYLRGRTSRASSIIIIGGIIPHVPFLTKTRVAAENDAGFSSDLLSDAYCRLTFGHAEGCGIALTPS